METIGLAVKETEGFSWVRPLKHISSKLFDYPSLHFLDFGTIWILMVRHDHNFLKHLPKHKRGNLYQYSVQSANIIELKRFKVVWWFWALWLVKIDIHKINLCWCSLLTIDQSQSPKFNSPKCKTIGILYEIVIILGNNNSLYYYDFIKSFHILFIS